MAVVSGTKAPVHFGRSARAWSDVGDLPRFRDFISRIAKHQFRRGWKMVSDVDTAAELVLAVAFVWRGYRWSQPLCRWPYPMLIARVGS